MKKALLLLTIIMLVSLGALTGCSLFGGKDTNTSTQASNEGATKKEVETEEKEKEAKDKESEELKNTAESKTESSSEDKEVNSNSNNSSKTSESSSDSNSDGQENQVDWGSAWTRDIQFDHALLEITQKSSNTFSFKLHATNAMDAEAVKRGAVNVGEVTGTAKVDGDVATQTVPDPDTGCQIKMTNYAGYVQVETVTDCSGAAGMRVHFDGKYKKGNIPEPEITIEDEPEDNTNDNFEPSEDEAQNNNDQTTEGDSQSGVESNTADQSEDSGESETSENSAQPITKDEARQLVVNYLHPDNPESIIEYDHDDNGDYIFHYYIVVDDPNIEDDGHTATFGWYGVNPNTKEIYDYMAAMD
ncbi:hypothetical protein [Priestia megaterium]|uniref:Lipoprotein n=1 Tax=Priestia megaterium TaxID=1404 RepID=A0A6M6DYU3_PRIMG|nr:hypothetical protein [Priestia megaterium]QJX79942.1 hypothetical protein FDZ14_27970 [Priestia megaterium]